MVGLVAVLIAIVLPSYGDYAPHANVANVISQAAALRRELGESCGDGSSRLEQAAADLAASKLPQVKVVAEQKLRVGRDGAIVLEFRLNEIRWGAPWRQWSVAIPAGSTVIFDGKCAGKGQLEWRISRLTSVPVEFLPRALQEQLRDK